MQFALFYYREPLKILRASDSEKLFRQSKQNFARIVNPLRRNFVTNDGKDAVAPMCVELLEVSYKIKAIPHNSGGTVAPSEISSSKPNSRRQQ